MLMYLQCLIFPYVDVANDVSIEIINTFKLNSKSLNSKFFMITIEKNKYNV